MRLIVDYRRQFLAGVLRGDEGEAERVKQAQAEAEARNAREYEETAQTLAAKKELTAEDEAELGKLWKNLVKLYHPDRFAHEPDKLDTYGKLTAAINRAKDNGDFATLRQIADDPHGFILKQGWTSLDFRDEEQAKRLEQLYVSLMAEIRNMLTLRERLHQSPEFELYQLTTKQPAMLDAVVEKQTKLLEAEIAELTRETERLAAEIGKLTGHPAAGADATPHPSGPASAPEDPPPARQEQAQTRTADAAQRTAAEAAANATTERTGQTQTSYVWYFCDRCRAENCATDFFVGTRRACSHCGHEMVVPGTPRPAEEQKSEPVKSAKRYVYAPMPEPNFSEAELAERAGRVRRAKNWANVKGFVGCVISTIFGTLMIGMLGSAFGQTGGLVGLAAGAVVGLMLGRNAYFPGPEKPRKAKKPKKPEKPKKAESEGKVAGVIGLIILFVIVALVGGFHHACVIAAIIWGASAFIKGVASATADEIEKRKKP